MKCLVDASFDVHPYMKSHMGSIISIGKGSIYSTSIRQNINKMISMEDDMVGVDGVMTMILWCKYFLESQGYSNNIDIFKDNQSYMLLEKNGRAFSGKRARHINIRYFFMSDGVKSGEVNIKYCPTDDMIGDYFTKPLQGAKFSKFKGKILNVQVNCDGPVPTSGVVPQEFVGYLIYQ